MWSCGGLKKGQASPPSLSAKKNPLESLAFQGTISTETWWAHKDSNLGPAD